ncbi:MAG: DUF721 domain-containing protein [Alkalilacustris sp.]
MPSPGPTSPPARRARGFRHAAALVEDRIRSAGEKRGFATARLLTRWDEIVGPETARLARPVKLGWARGKRAQGLGATLTLAVPGPAAPMVQMLAPRIVERVNAALGFAAIARIALAQDADTRGFAEPAPAFAPAPPRAEPPDRTARTALAAEATRAVQDPALRAALERLGRSVLSRHDNRKGAP